MYISHWEPAEQEYRLWIISGNGKGKFLPRTGTDGPEGELFYSSTLPSLR
jgi:hypothetical protein